ncbi:hypothetical protein BV22DRAFT_1110947 [Leucogyrophana mollusca]|uniref:Uncharacterized protein n=1 Tax=Leucogyrophana mollusca TaxID=85980 RepID=A0ACB8BP83_9AGAM|nr:hypothetical protein BV22DRAFT_1110947 [Leucogyrophana mollusca]
MSSNFAPSPAELALVNQIFAQADTQKLGILTGDVAVKVFGGAKLSPSVLGEIWGMADDDNNGFLTKKGVAIAVRLMGWAQKGEKMSQALLSKPGPLATIEGVQAPLAPQTTGMSAMSIPKSPPPGLPVLTPQDKAKFSRLFQGCGPVNGLLSGDKARDVFVKSKLPVDKLSQIWSLCDTQDRGSLDSTDFTIAMYLIQACMSGQLSFVPTTLPPGLYEQAGGRHLDGVAAHSTGGSAALSSPAASSFAPKHPAVQSQLTGQLSSAPPLPSRRPGGSGLAPTVPAFPSAAPQATGHWDVTAAEKAGADRFFDTLDSQHHGYIEGDVAVPFMLQSKLSEDILAQVWDLADINNDGRLTRDGFAVAMHLIQSKLSGKDIPDVLPSTLIPPSMRANGTAFAAPPKPQEQLRDLLWDDSPPPSAVHTQPQMSGLQPQSTGSHHVAFAPPPSSHPTQTPQDPFGASAATSSFNRDLLGDDDDTHSSPPLHDQSAEIGNVQNQLNSTNRSLNTTKAEREALEATLANQAAQLSALQTQLASAKASYETETTLLATLRERHATQSAEIQKGREELIRGESDLSAVRVEKAEVEGAFLRDKEEVRDLNRRMAEASAQITAVKQEIEKAKKDAKQQKGLLAIAKKQLATKEAEKAKVDKELLEAQEEVTSTIKEREEAEAELEKDATIPSHNAFERAKSPTDSLSFAAAQPLPLTPDLTGAMSPASVKSNNPFERLAMSSDASTPRSQSPFLPFNQASLPTPPGLSSPPGLGPPAHTVATQEDPFGFSQAFGTKTEPGQPSDNAPDTDAVDFGTTTPRATSKSVFGEMDDMVSSPISEEQFSTPPNGVSPGSQQAAPATSHPVSLDSSAVHFPAIDDISGVQPVQEHHDETDLSTDLQELDVDDTDSDTDSDEEDYEAEQRPTGDSKSTPTAETSVSNASISFDDAFGETNDGAEQAPLSATPASPPQTDITSPDKNGSAAVDVFGAPFSTGSNSVEASQAFSPSTTAASSYIVVPHGTSGLNSFDEALGKISNQGPTQPASTFSFDSAFEDNFDFGSATGSASPFPPLPTAAAAAANGTAASSKNAVAPANGAPDIFSRPVNSGTPAAPPAQAAPASFDDAFSSGPWNPPAAAPTADKSAPAHTDVGGISFEDAFGGLESSQALKLDNSFSSRSSKAFTSSASPPPSEAGKPFPSVSPPTSPRGPSSPRVTSIRSASPQPRATSPPPRAASPKLQRPSTSSSTKEVVHEKPAPPPRHSKLSIRLPFGKKKKQDSVPPLPSSHLSHQLTTVEEPNTTPAVEDDVEPVKQLAAMGFSRNQAVAALEAHDYDVQRALNSLLGAQ